MLNFIDRAMDAKTDHDIKMMVLTMFLCYKWFVLYTKIGVKQAYGF